MGKFSVIIYITVTLLILFLISHSPTKSSNNRHRRLKIRSTFSFSPTDRIDKHHEPIPFDPLVAEIERNREDKQWEKQHFAHSHTGFIDAPAAESQPEWEDFMDAEDYLNDEDKFNVTNRIILLFPKIDIDPIDGFVSEAELTDWNLRQAEKEVMHRTERDMELHDKNHDGFVSFAEYDPPSWVQNSDNNSFGYDMGWWKEEHFNASDASFYINPPHLQPISFQHKSTSLSLSPRLSILFNMTSSISTLLLQLLLIVSFFHFSLAGRRLTELVTEQPLLLKYHNGPLLSGKISINLIWYGKFKPSQRAIVSDFLNSLYPSKPQNQNNPSVSTWWKTTQKYYHLSSKKPNSLLLSIGKQILDENYSMGKSLTSKQIVRLAAKGEQKNAINVVLTSSDVTVEGFCSSRCGTHGSSLSSSPIKNKNYKFAYIWVGNSETQCPGQCAWPFHQPIYGPQSPPLVAPNNDVGMDGMVINLASLLAGTATNPFGNGYYQGPAEAPLEAASACPGVYGKGAYPGYAGELLMDSSSGGSYNAHGVNGRKYLLPALFDPSTSSCSTLV